MVDLQIFVFVLADSSARFVDYGLAGLIGAKTKWREKTPDFLQSCCQSALNLRFYTQLLVWCRFLILEKQLVFLFVGFLCFVGWFFVAVVLCVGSLVFQVFFNSGFVWLCIGFWFVGFCFVIGYWFWLFDSVVEERRGLGNSFPSNRR